MKKPVPVRRRFLVGLSLLLTSAAISGFAHTAPSGGGSDARDGTGTGAGAGAEIDAIMSRADYRHAQWGLLELDPTTGGTRHSRLADRFLVPGSTAKLFSVSGAWRTLGGDHRFTTPVHSVGVLRGGTLDGDLALVAQGDLTLGGRTRPDGTVAFTDLDHTYANDIPGATLTPQNPLAGIDDLARQVRRFGITRVEGNVIVDDRLFRRDPDLDPAPTPLIVNDNVIDLLTTPGARAGTPARLDWRPKVAPYRVTSTVRTVAAGEPTEIRVATFDRGTRIRLSGTIAADADPVLRVSDVVDPAAFGRTALIEALERAGVEVAADPTGPNPADELPASYQGRPKVAAYTSPPYAEYARLILKVSHNLGANLAVCLMATTTGSRDCMAGFPVLADFLERAGVDRRQVQLADGRGGNPADRATPTAEAQMLTYWLRTPEAARFREALPVLGVDGTLADSCRDCPARGKVFAKTGTFAGLDALNDRLAVASEALAGYLDTGGGHYHVFYVAVNGASTPTLDIEGVLRIADDVADIAARLQEDAERRH